MPFADFLANVGRGTAIGQVAQSFGGRTPGQQRRDAFVNQELPAFADQIERAQSRQDIEKGARGLLTSGLKAGLPPAQLDKLMDMVVQPALRNVQGQELESIRRDYGPQAAQPRPEGTEGPLTQEGSFIEARPARNPMADPEGAFRMYQATGAKPEHLENIFQAPAKIAGEEAKAGVERERALAAQRKARTIESLPDTPQPGGMISPRSMAAIHEPGLTQYEPQRERPADPLEEKRGAVMDATVRNLNRLANQPPGGVQRPRQYHVDAGDRIEVYNTDTNELIRSIPKSAAPGVETTTETPPQGFHLEATLAGIARDAYKQGLTTPEQIKEFAKSRNVILEGEPKIEGGGMLSGDARLTGVTGVSGRPKVVTKGKPGQVPTGQPAAPKPGTIVRGYRFKGGDPANQANWEQVK